MRLFIGVMGCLLASVAQATDVKLSQLRLVSFAAVSPNESTEEENNAIKLLSSPRLMSIVLNESSGDQTSGASFRALPVD